MGIDHYYIVTESKTYTLPIPIDFNTLTFVKHVDTELTLYQGNATVTDFTGKRDSKYKGVTKVECLYKDGVWYTL